MHVRGAFQRISALVLLSAGIAIEGKILFLTGLVLFPSWLSPLTWLVEMSINTKSFLNLDVKREMG